MILVAVGASQFPFDRLLRAVEDLPGVEPVVVQHGPSEVRPSGARCMPFVPFEDLADLVRSARVVVTHAGVGSILLSLTNGTRPYVVPRRRAYGETVDDHQLESARRFAAAGLVTLVEDPQRLREALAAGATTAADVHSNGGTLVRDLAAYLAAIIPPIRPSAT
jgi:UDP-N-acetylglucosamine transferase subunit ALG13